MDYPITSVVSLKLLYMAYFIFFEFMVSKAFSFFFFFFNVGNGKLLLKKYSQPKYTGNVVL